MPSSGSPGPQTAEGPARAADAPEITVHGRISEATARAVLELVSAATEEDGVGPLSEHVMLHLRYGGDAPAPHPLLVLHCELAGDANPVPADPDLRPRAEPLLLPLHPPPGPA